MALAIPEKWVDIGVKYHFTHCGNMTDEEVLELYELMKAEGSIELVFYNEKDYSAEAWLRFIRSGQCWAVRCMHSDGSIVGVWWLTSFLGRAAMAHFCMLGSGSFNEKVAVGQQSIHWLANLGIVDSLYAITPCTYRHVSPFLKAIGFDRIWQLKGACDLVHSGINVAGVINILDIEKYQS